MVSTDISAKIIQKSADFISKALRDELLDNELQFFKEIQAESLTELLESEKKVFWLNIYNGIVQMEMAKMNSQKVDKGIFSNAEFKPQMQLLG